MRAGWVLIGIGVGSAALFQHLDSVLFGAMIALFGVWVLTIREAKA